MQDSNHMQPSRMLGVTIVELVVAITLASFIVLSLIPLLIYMFSFATSISRSVGQVSEVQNAMNMIIGDLQITRRFYDRSFHDSNQPRSASDNTWRFESDPRALILQLPATDRPYQDSARKLVYDSTTGTCGDDAQPYYVQAVYFVYESSLYRRMLNPSGSVACGGVAVSQQQSCLPSGGCSQSDLKLLDNVTGFNVEYFHSPSDVESDFGVFDTGGSGLVHSSPYRAVKVTVEQTKEIDGGPSVHALSYRGVISWQ